MRPRLSLKVKFTLALGGLLALTTVSLGWILLLQVEKSALRDLRDKASILAKGLADGSELGVFTHNADLLDPVLAPLREQTDVAYAAVADERGAILAEHLVPGFARPVDWASVSFPRAGAARGGSLLIRGRREVRGVGVDYVAAPILSGRAASGEDVGLLLGGAPAASRRRIGTVCVGVSTAGVMQRMHLLRGRLALVTLAVLLAGMAIAVLLVRVIVKPVKHLVHATERIAAGDLGILLERGSRDEIGALAESFNTMTLRLRESRQALETSNAALEDKVRERTRALQEAHSQLIQAEKMSVVGQLVSGVAHELNNPLAGVLGYSQLLQRKGVQGDIARGLQKIESEAERCKRIVQNLLIFARKHKPRKSLVDLNAVVESTLELRAYHLKVDNVTVVRDLEAGLPRTMADMNQMQQVLLNMINNAQHAMADTARQRVLTLRSRHRDGRIEIAISDTGSGISPEHLSRVFDPFFTTKEVGRGTGLGLSICYGIVQEHRGSIEVCSQPDSGTTFTIDLPVQADVSGAEPEAMSLQEVMGGSPTRKGHILLVDDEKSILDVIGDVLRMDGHNVETTTSGSTALGRVRQERFDVILSDLKMPGMSGQELFERLAEIDGSLCKRLVFTTGDLASPDTLDFLERTGNPYLQKPFDLNSVRRLVQAMLSGAPGPPSSS